MKKFITGFVLSLLASTSWAQTSITFDVVFHTVYEASGNFAPVLNPIVPGPFNNNQPIPPPNLSGQVTLTLIDGTTTLAELPFVNTITLNGSFSTESGNAPANSWTENVFVDAEFSFYAPDSYVALDNTSDPRNFPLIAGTAVDGLISDQGPASAYGGTCPFPGGCLSANVYELFPGGTVIFNTTTQATNYPTFADAGNHPLVSGNTSQTTNPNSLAYDNGIDGLVIEAVLDNLNGLQPYGDGVDGNPGIVRIVTFSDTGNTAYLVEGSIIEVPVPIPGAAWLFASGLGLLGWLRRRARKPMNSQAKLRSTVACIAIAGLLTGCFDGSTNPPPTNPDNQTPVPDAGPPQTVVNQTLVILDGSGSTDADGDTLSYAWEFTTVPAGSLAVLARPNTVDPDFTPDLVGDYVIEMDIDDGFANGTATDTVTITAEDAGTNPPVADAGPDQSVLYSPPSLTVNLDGTGSSDPDGDPLTYDWQILSFVSASGLPPATPVVLFGADTQTPFFNVTDVDQLGVYTVGLTVDDGVLFSSDEVVITVAKGMPTANLLFSSGMMLMAGLAWQRRRKRTSQQQQ